MTDEKMTRDQWMAQATDEQNRMYAVLDHYFQNGGGERFKQLVREANKETSLERFKTNMWDVGRVKLDSKEDEKVFEDNMEFVTKARKRLSFVVDRFWLVIVGALAMWAVAAFGEGVVRSLTGG